MKYGILITLLMLLAGCYSPTAMDQNDDMRPELQLGSICRLNTCPDCSPVSSCPLAQQEMKGMSCSCTTINGIQTGVVE